MILIIRQSCVRLRKESPSAASKKRWSQRLMVIRLSYPRSGLWKPKRYKKEIKELVRKKDVNLVAVLVVRVLLTITTELIMAGYRFAGILACSWLMWLKLRNSLFRWNIRWSGWVLCFTVLYASNSAEVRKKTWEALVQFNHTLSLPWLIAEDFNEVLKTTIQYLNLRILSWLKLQI